MIHFMKLYILWYVSHCIAAHSPLMQKTCITSYKNLVFNQQEYTKLSSYVIEDTVGFFYTLNCSKLSMGLPLFMKLHLLGLHYLSLCAMLLVVPTTKSRKVVLQCYSHTQSNYEADFTL